MERKQGKTVRSQARNMVRRVIRVCDQEAREGKFMHPLQQATVRAAEYVGVPVSTVKRIRREASSSEEDELLKSPGKKRPRLAEYKFFITEEEKKTIKDLIHEFYVEKEIVPTGPKLMAAIREKMDLPWKMHTLRDLLRDMGYKWRRSKNIRRILIERSSIVAWRSKYFKTIQHYRTQGRPIIYLDETWVDDRLTLRKCWQSRDEFGSMKNDKSASGIDRFIIVHAGGREGFLEGADAVLKPRTTTADYHGQKDADDFEKWITEKLIPQLPEISVVVLDNAPYSTVLMNKPPTKYSRKQDMINWLVENNIPHTSSMRKFELSELIQRHKPQDKTFRTDQILTMHGHATLQQTTSAEEVTTTSCTNL